MIVVNGLRRGTSRRCFFNDTTRTPTKTASRSTPSQDVASDIAQSKPNGSGWKSVSFDLSRNTEYENRLYAAEDMADLGLWYSSENFRDFKLAALRDSRTAKRRAFKEGKSSYIETMDCLHKVCISVSSSKALSRIPLHSFKDEEVIEYLGLEPCLLPKYAAIRQSRRQELFCVLFSQYYERQHANAEERDEAVCRAIRRVSQPDKIFAGVVARTRAIVQT